MKRQVIIIGGGASGLAAAIAAAREGAGSDGSGAYGSGGKKDTFHWKPDAAI